MGLSVLADWCLWSLINHALQTSRALSHRKKTGREVGIGRETVPNNKVPLTRAWRAAFHDLNVSPRLPLLQKDTSALPPGTTHSSGLIFVLTGEPQYVS